MNRTSVLYFLQIDSRCSTGYLVICWLHCISISSVNCNESKFILPSLPETPYTLNDVIILPKNEDCVEITVVSTETNTVLTAIKLTLGSGFRIDNESTNSNASIESGLQISTFSKVTLVIRLTTGMLHVPSTDDYASKYHIFTADERLDESDIGNLFIQSSLPETILNLCLFNYEADDVVDQSSHEILLTQNCTRKSISTFEKLLLNNTSMLHGIEIISDRPVSILEGHRTHLSSLARNGRDFNTSKTSVSPISWRIILPYRDWSNQFVLIPSQDRREVKLWIMSLENTTVDIFTHDEVMHRNLTAKIPTSIRVAVEKGVILTIAGNKKVSLNCIESNAINCNEDILPVIDAEVNYSVSNNSVNKSNEYQWIYIPNGSTVNILCPTFVNVGLYSSNGTAECAEELNLNASNRVLSIKYFRQTPEGVYKLLVNDSLHLCSVTHLKREISYPKNNMNNESISGVFSSSLIKSLKMLKNKSTVPSSTIEPFATPNNVQTNSNTETTETGPSSKELFMNGENMTTNLLFVEGVQNLSASFNSHELSTNSTNYEITTFKTENYTMSNKVKLNDTFKLSTLQNDSVQKSRERDKKKDSYINSDINHRFKAVVDIKHTRNGTVNTLLSKDKNSTKRNNPTYIYRININDRYDQEGDGKSPLAVIVSLVSALLAVGAIILIFLLKEFFSRRKQIRNTRIRPFISYY